MEELTELTEAEHHLLAWTRQLAAIAKSNAQDAAPASWRYRSQTDLLLRRGRLFTPAPALGGLGAEGECYRNASDCADSNDEVVYAEGIASGAVPVCLEHAWCVIGSFAVDPTWPDGKAYLCLPLVDAYRRQRQEETGRDALLWAPSVIDILRNGLPENGVADIGRPVPQDA